MKKILALLVLTVVLSCSSDEELNVFDSHIMLNGAEWSHSPNDPNAGHGAIPYPITTSFSTEGEGKTRTFYFSRSNAIGNDIFMSITIHFPDSQSGINGTYDFSAAAHQSGHYASGQYQSGSNLIYHFDSGEVIVTAGSHKDLYKLVFHDVHGNFPPLQSEVVFTGYFYGSFKRN
jgi:hypothetical protein